MCYIQICVITKSVVKGLHGISFYLFFRTCWNNDLNCHSLQVFSGILRVNNRLETSNDNVFGIQMGKTMLAWISKGVYTNRDGKLRQ